MFKATFSLRPSARFQSLNHHAPDSAIKTRYSERGIFKPIWQSRTLVSAASRRAGDRMGYGPRIRHVGDSRHVFTGSVPAAFTPVHLPEGFNVDGLTHDDHAALHAFQQEMDQAGTDYTQIEQQVAALHAQTEHVDHLTPEMHRTAQQALAQIDQMSQRLTQRAADIEQQGLARPSGASAAQMNAPAQRMRPTTVDPRPNTPTPALPTSRRESWRLDMTPSLKPQRQLSGQISQAVAQATAKSNSLRPSSELESGLRLQVNRMMQLSGSAAANRQTQMAMRAASLHSTLDHMASEVQLQRAKIEDKLQMKPERRRSQRPRNEIPPPALVPKKREDEKV